MGEFPPSWIPWPCQMLQWQQPWGNLRAWDDLWSWLRILLGSHDRECPTLASGFHSSMVNFDAWFGMSPIQDSCGKLLPPLCCLWRGSLWYKASLAGRSNFFGMSDGSKLRTFRHQQFVDHFLRCQKVGDHPQFLDQKASFAAKNKLPAARFSMSEPRCAQLPGEPARRKIQWKMEGSKSVGSWDSQDSEAFNWSSSVCDF